MKIITKDKIELKAIVDLQPSDIIVMQFHEPVTIEKRVQIKGKLTDTFPNNEVILLTDEMELSVLRKEILGD